MQHEKTCVGELMKTLIGTSPFCKTTIFMKLLKDTKGLISHSKLPQYQKEAAVLKQKLLVSFGLTRRFDKFSNNFTHVILIRLHFKYRVYSVKMEFSSIQLTLKQLLITLKPYFN